MTALTAFTSLTPLTGREYGEYGEYGEYPLTGREYYYFEIFIEEQSVHQEIFVSTPEQATKYIAYKEQSIRENNNFFKEEKNIVKIHSKYYKALNVHAIDEKEINNMEIILKELSELRTKIIDVFRKVKEYC